MYKFSMWRHHIHHLMHKMLIKGKYCMCSLYTYRSPANSPKFINFMKRAPESHVTVYVLCIHYLYKLTKILSLNSEISIFRSNIHQMIAHIFVNILRVFFHLFTHIPTSSSQ